MTPGTLQTGFLFARAGRRPPGRTSPVDRLASGVPGGHRVVQGGGARTAEHHQSFADSFVNERTHAAGRGRQRIGGKGVSTALVASLTVPVDEIAGIVGSRLLREAIGLCSRRQLES